MRNRFRRKRKRLLKFHMLNDTTMMAARTKTGMTMVACCSAGVLLFVSQYGPYLESHNMRYALAGTTANIIVEVATHAIDTINMRSKAFEGNTATRVSNLYKEFSGARFFSLFSGI